LGPVTGSPNPLGIYFSEKIGASYCRDIGLLCYDFPGVFYIFLFYFYKNGFNFPSQ
jgi:hypothetical protein